MNSSWFKNPWGLWQHAYLRSLILSASSKMPYKWPSQKKSIYCMVPGVTILAVFHRLLFIFFPFALFTWSLLSLNRIPSIGRRTRPIVSKSRNHGFPWGSQDNPSLPHHEESKDRPPPDHPHKMLKNASLPVLSTFWAVSQAGAVLRIQMVHIGYTCTQPTRSPKHKRDKMSVYGSHLLELSYFRTQS